MILDHIHGTTVHKRHGSLHNAFKYGVDYMLLDMENRLKTPILFSRNRRNVISLLDKDHGGERGTGTGPLWARQVLRDFGVSEFADAKLLLLAQPRVYGHVFNPVSFWLFFDQDDGLRVVIAEVNNTYGERHSYVCFHDDLRPILPSDVLVSDKEFHVSPFQPVSGAYQFRFDIQPTKLGIWIDFKDGGQGVFANFTGRRQPVTNGSILRSMVMRPLGSLRVVGLIYYQALKLKWKGALFRSPPEPPANEVSR